MTALADRLPHDLSVLVDELFALSNHPDGRRLLQQETLSLSDSTDRLGELLFNLAVIEEQQAAE